MTAFRKPCPSDAYDDERAPLASYLAPLPEGAGQREDSLRAVLRMAARARRVRLWASRGTAAPACGCGNGKATSRHDSRPAKVICSLAATGRYCGAAADKSMPHHIGAGWKSRNRLEIDGVSLSVSIAALARNGFKDTFGGLVSAVLLIGNIVSFGALMFPGALNAGVSLAIWAMLIGAGIGGVCIALATSIPPLTSGIDSPTGTVLVVLSASTGPAMLSAGTTPHQAIETVMIVFTAATVLSGAVLYALGAARLAGYLRFVPYFVVGGFLAATGGFLIAGGIRMAIGRPLSLAVFSGGWTPVQGMNLAAACGVLATLLIVRRCSRSAYATPCALVAMWAGSALILKLAGLTGPSHGFYLPSLGSLSRWSPLAALLDMHVGWTVAFTLLPQLAAVAIIALISLVTKVSSMEVTRQVSADLDQEFRAHGLASLISAPFGGIIVNLQVGTGRLLEQTGCETRLSGVICAATLGLVGLSSFNLPGIVPIPIIAGLVFSLAHTFIVDALKRPLAQRARVELMLILAMTIICLRYGFLSGIGIGLVVACVLFAASYARRGVVRRHATRASFGSNVDRSANADRFLIANGAVIQIYWLTGFIFFGSSEALLERIQSDAEAAGAGGVKHIVLDFYTVTGADTSAIISFTKLHSFCSKRGISIVYCALSPATLLAFTKGGLIRARDKDRVFDDLAQGLAWCEDEVMRQAGPLLGVSEVSFEPWLQETLGPAISVVDLLRYFSRNDVSASEVIYREGEAADTIDLVAAGSLVVDIAKANSARARIGRIATFSVVGEMGFLRHTTRSATVSSDGPATLFTLTRANLLRMRRERPDLASAFDDFLLRRLADRVAFANATVSALLA